MAYTNNSVQSPERERHEVETRVDGWGGGRQASRLAKEEEWQAGTVLRYSCMSQLIPVACWREGGGVFLVLARDV